MAQQQLSTDAITGGLLLLAGGGLLALTWHYPSGTLSEIGPGMILQVSGASLAVLGGLMLLRSLKQSVVREGESRPLALRPFVVPAAMAAFVTLLFGYGLRLPVSVWPGFAA